MKKRRLKKEVLLVIAVLISVIAIAVVMLVYKNNTAFNYTDCLNENVLTINDTNINLKELSYYIIKLERDVNERALLYNSDSPTSYWNMYMNDVNDSGYVSELALKAAVDYCVRDNVYCMEAAEAGYELDMAIKNEVAYTAEDFYNHMTKREKEVTGLTKEDLEIIIYKETLSYNYMAYLVSNDSDDILSAIVLKYDVGGTYYEFVKGKYIIERNNDILSMVKMGYITIN